MRSEFENWFKTTDAYKLLDEMNYFNTDLFTFKEHRSQYQHTSVQIAYMTWQHQQSKVDELQKRVDAAHDALTELKEKSEALHHRWQIFSDSVALAEAEMIDMCVKELEQALKGGEE
ncbi:TPA: hypothetical protein ACXJFM_000814 [Acinetobacter nosocomialis]